MQDFITVTDTRNLKTFSFSPQLCLITVSSRMTNKIIFIP